MYRDVRERQRGRTVSLGRHRLHERAALHLPSQGCLMSLCRPKS